MDEFLVDGAARAADIGHGTIASVQARRAIWATVSSGAWSEVSSQMARDLTTCVLGFVRDRVTPVADWVTWTGGDPQLVVLVIAETLRSIADGLEGEPGDE